MKKILMSVMTIVAVATMATGATSAYFSDTEFVQGNTFSTGTVNIDSTWRLPLTMQGLYPGATIVSDQAAVKYAGTLNGDLYFGFSGYQSVFGKADLSKVVELRVQRVDADGNHVRWETNWMSSKKPFEEYIKIASNLQNNEWARYKMHARMSVEADDTYQNITETITVVLYAQQAGAPAPTGVAPFYVTP